MARAFLASLITPWSRLSLALFLALFLAQRDSTHSIASIGEQPTMSEDSQPEYRYLQEISQMVSLPQRVLARRVEGS